MVKFTRRQVLGRAGLAAIGFAGRGSSLAGIALGRIGARPGSADPAIAGITPKGILIGECRIPGETRADDVVPAHPNGIPASRRRWLLVCATRGFRGVDDDLSIIYQLRDGAPDGRLIKEGRLARSLSDWDPLGDGNTRHVKQHGHPVAFGVPKGALVAGGPAPSANLFVVKWRRVARDYDPARKFLLHSTADPEIEHRTQAVEWVQFRLNEAEDDIEILQPARQLRQKGFETGPRICAAPVRYMNESFVQAVPYRRDGTEWADCCHFDSSRAACLKYRFNPGLGLYEWTEVGPLLGLGRNARPIEAAGGAAGVIEPSLARWRDRWIIAARGGGTGGSTWWQTEDPFEGNPRPVNPDHPKITAPMTAYTWEDGVLRLFSGDATVSPYRNSRDPLYCWDIDPDRGFRATHRRTIFDTFQAGLPLPAEAGPKVDMCKLLPGQGRTQTIVYRVSIRAFNHPYQGGLAGNVLATPAEKAACAIYYSTVTYAENFPPAWEF